METQNEISLEHMLLMAVSELEDYSGFNLRIRLDSAIRNIRFRLTEVEIASIINQAKTKMIGMHLGSAETLMFRVYVHAEEMFIEFKSPEKYYAEAVKVACIEKGVFCDG